MIVNAELTYVLMLANIMLSAQLAAVKIRFGYHLGLNVKTAHLAQVILLDFVSVQTASRGLVQPISARQEALILRTALEN